MKLAKANSASITVELTRRNLKSLLAKLDGNPPNSACMLEKYEAHDPENGVHLERASIRVVVRAVEDAEHYSDRLPGEIHEDTAAAML